MAQLNLAVVGLDGHGPVFAETVNGPHPPVAGMRVVKAISIPSVMVDDATLMRNVERTKAVGVEVVETAEALADGVDGILITHDDGSLHLDLVEQFAVPGKPVFVDKPLDASAARASRLAEVCSRRGSPMMTGSALRFSPELRAVLDNADAGPVRSAMTFSPIIPSVTMPGWIYYAIHAVDPLFALMGPGCKQVACLPNERGPLAIGTWDDGRQGVAKANAHDQHCHAYGFTVWRAAATESAVIDTAGIYDGLLKTMKTFFASGIPPFEAHEAVEVIAFMEAANSSMAEGGKPVELRLPPS